MRWLDSVKARALLGGLSLIILGGVLGVTIDRHLHQAPAHGGAAGLHDAAVASLQERLDLDDAQRRAIDSILGAHHATLRQTWARLHAELGATVDTVHRDIEAALSPEQRAEFQAWLAGMAPAGP